MVGLSVRRSRVPRPRGIQRSPRLPGAELGSRRVGRLSSLFRLPGRAYKGVDVAGFVADIMLPGIFRSGSVTDRQPETGLAGCSHRRAWARFAICLVRWLEARVGVAVRRSVFGTRNRA